MWVRLRHNGESEPTHKGLLKYNSVEELINMAYDRLRGKASRRGASDHIIFYDREGDQQVRRQDCQDGDEIWVALHNIHLWYTPKINERPLYQLRTNQVVR